MTYWVLKDNDMIVPRSTVRPLTRQEQSDELEIKDRTAFDRMISDKFGKFDHEEVELFENDEMDSPLYSDNESMKNMEYQDGKFTKSDTD